MSAVTIHIVGSLPSGEGQVSENLCLVQTTGSFIYDVKAMIKLPVEFTYKETSDICLVDLVIVIVIIVV
ncbi:hypothetical protein [Abyssisolibacter fermentans]|uniref:hypothetical protein n=1 Tax=Abyssisolibacter fermentans TaxID=1766203 RepID=UPI00082AF3B9|nr:hypothetical protein [Abyssisolibacter fermentans]